MRRFSSVFALAALAAIYACGSSDDSSAPPGNGDAGGSDGSSDDGSALGDSGAGDGAPSDGSAGEGGKVDGGSLHTGLVTCDAPFRVDTAGGAQHGVAVVANGSKALVAWHDTNYETRSLDGATLGTVLSLGADVNAAPLLVADDAGHAYAQFMTSANSGQRQIYAFATGAFTVTPTFTASAVGDTYDAITGTHSGALSVFADAAHGVNGDQSTGTAWSTSGIASAGTANNAYDIRAAAAFGADARAVVYFAYEMGMLTLHVVTSNGSTTWAEAKRTISTSVPYAGNFAVAVYANGDPFVAWDDRSGHMTGARYRVATTTWDADVTIDTYDAPPIGTGSIPHVTIDSADHLTVAWAYASGPNAYHTYYRRDVGAGLGVRKTLPASAATKLVVDPFGTTYLLTGEIVGDGGSAHVAIRRAGAGEPTFSDVGDTGIVTTIAAPSAIPEPAAVAFDSSNYPIVVGLDSSPTLSPANGVAAVRCH